MMSVSGKARDGADEQSQVRPGGIVECRLCVPFTAVSRFF